jgi:hypothetical protein
LEKSSLNFKEFFLFGMEIDFFKKIIIMSNKPKCGCGNTLDPNGYCDGSHNKD